MFWRKKCSWATLLIVVSKLGRPRNKIQVFYVSLPSSRPSWGKFWYWAARTSKSQTLQTCTNFRAAWIKWWLCFGWGGRIYNGIFTEELEISQRLKVDIRETRQEARKVRIFCHQRFGYNCKKVRDANISTKFSEQRVAIPKSTHKTFARSFSATKNSKIRFCHHKKKHREK